MSQTAPSPAQNAALTDEQRLELLTIMLNCRANDLAEQACKRRGQGHFQMASLGHEAMAGVALAMHENDWFHPHYRDRAVVLGRGVTHEQLFLDYFGKRDSSTGGRQMPCHYNSRRHRIVSLSSPVATNMLQAVGMAMTLKERKLNEVVVTTMGDAASREGEVMEAIAQAVVDQLPVVFLFEDNRWGISTSTVGKTFWTMKNSLVTDENGELWWFGCPVVEIDGLDPEAVYAATQATLEKARNGGGPTIVIAKLERLGSHSSSDDQRLYRSEEELDQIKARDPVERYARKLLTEKVLTEADLEKRKADIQTEVDAAVARAKSAPDPDPANVLDSALAPLPDDLPTAETALPAPLAKRSGGMTMAQCISLVLEQEMRRNARITVFGEDIEDPKGDVFSTTKGLSTKFPARVKNSPLAEGTIIGTAVGRAILGDVPVPCIQFVDFMGPGLNQLFNEVITFYWRSMGQWNCPMVIMSPYGAYLPGLGPWHSQTNEAIYAHMPGMHVVIPSNPGDAAGLLRFSLRCNRPVLYLYPKALLHGAEDTVKEPSVECLVPFGVARTVRPGRDLTVVTWGNCVAICRQAAHRAAQEGIEAEVLDLRTITPWDVEAVVNSVSRTGRLLVVHEDGKTCGLGGDIIAEVVARAYEKLQAPPERITKSDDHNPYQFGLELSILPSVDGVLRKIHELAEQRMRPSEAAGDGQYVAPAAGMAPLPSVSGSVRRAAAPARPAAPAAPASGPTKVPIMVPKQSPTDEDATVVKFHVKPGDRVSTGTVVAEMEANKGSFEIESTHEGTVVELLAREGQNVRVDTPLVTLEVAAGTVVEAGGALAEPAGGPEAKVVQLSSAQLQVGALALKSQLEIPTVSVETEVDVTELVGARKKLQAGFEAKHKTHVTYTHVILWAMVRAMMDEKYEGFRGRMDDSGENMLVYPHASIGFAAVDERDDLYSVVIKEADRLDFGQLVKRAQELTESVRSGSINTLDLQGGTITLTNIGAFEATGGTPFIIPGQVAMLCAGSLIQRPRYPKGVDTPQLRTILPLKLVFDHRPFNGSHGAGFLRAIKHHLETLKLDELMS